MTQAPTDYAEDVALSNVWRMRSSTVDVVELKYLLENMQDAARYLGRNPDFKVIWKGMESVPGFTDYGKKLVGLSYKFLEGQNLPTDPMLVDVLVGVLQHEMGHVRQGNIWAQTVMNDAPRSRRRVRGQRKVYERDVPRVIETAPPDLTKYERLATLILTDACIDTAMIREHRLRGAYIWRSRRFFKKIQDENLKKLAEQPDRIGWKGVAACWSAIAIYYDKIIVHRLSLRPDFEDMRPTLEKLMDCHLAAGQLEIEDPLDNEKLKELALRAGKILSEYDQQFPRATQQQPPPQCQTIPGGDEGDSEPSPFDDDDEAGEGAGSGKQQGEEDQNEGEEKGEGGQGETGEDEDGEGEEGASPEEDEAPQGEEDSGAGDADDDLEGQLVKGMTCSTHNKGGKPMPPDLAEKVFQAIEQEVEDITQRCSLGYGHMLMKRPGIDLSRATSIEEHSATELQEALSVLKERARQRTVGLKHGRINEGLLWKVGTTEETMFEREMIISDLDLRLGLVVDASSSIGPVQWQIMQDTIDGFVQAFGNREDIDLVVTAYQSGVVFRVFEPYFEGVRMLAVEPCGGTPTLPGLKMCLERLDETAQMRQRTLIISVTDGMPNEGGGQRDVEEWTHEQQKRGVDVIGLGVRHSCGGQYPRSVQVSSFDEVPEELKQLVLEMDEQQ